MDGSPRRRITGLPTRLTAVTGIGLLLVLNSAIAADWEAAQRLFITGQYDACRTATEQAIADRAWGERWHVLKAQSELATGRFHAARMTIDAGLKRYSRSIQLHLLGYQTYRLIGNESKADELLGQIDALALQAPWRYTDVDDLVTLGHAALLIGADARDVLDGFYERARRLAPDRREPALAIGNLALEKDDFELAAEIFAAAAKRIPDDPDIHFGLARAFASSDQERANAELEKTLEANPQHVGALLFQVNHLIDSEKYAAAVSLIEEVLSINPHEPSAWAFRAVIAHLTNDPKGEFLFHMAAQGAWGRNPEVEYLIGKKLSQHYRFAEGAEHQRRALRFDPQFNRARVQLSQDLLRLGDEATGWEMAESAHEADGYQVTTFNLLELRDRIAEFRTIESEHFIIRMDDREAALYGDRVVSLLERAHRTLCQKYDLELKGQVTVEIFPDENDFAVRTFGMPAVSGFLGVCFGRVITANSPATQTDNPANWESVLWHEFCHVVTLELTRNKMPRWLSEGISVYEERQENRAWGQHMTPRYREMILGGELTPISRLSSAFLEPKSSFHVQFAYYQSSMVVEFLIERFGLESLKLVLRDLGAGLPINEALPRHTDDLPILEFEFEKYARAQAEAFGTEVDWSQPPLTALLSDDGDALEQWVEEHPNNFAALIALAKSLIEDKRYEEAKQPLQELLRLCPEHTGADSASVLMAQVHRELGNTDAERELLSNYAARVADAHWVYLRLIDINSAADDWSEVAVNAQRLIAVNPLIPQPWRALAQAAEQLDDTVRAVEAWTVLLELDPNDPAEIHFRLASLLQHRDVTLAKRHVLLSLEEAPRFRAAHKLLLEVMRRQDETSKTK